MSALKVNAYINETIPIKVPRLLSDETIAAIKKQAASNRTCAHGYSKHPYLLSRMIFCQKCGRALHGQTQKNGKHRYYRHKNKTDCNCFSYIHADQIEADVLLHIFHLMGDQVGFQKAVKAAFPNTEQLEKDQRRLQQIGFELKNIATKKNRLVDAVMNGTLENKVVKSRMQKLEDQEDLLQTEKQSLLSVLETQPSQIEINNRFKYWKRFLQDKYTLDLGHLLRMSFGEKREMVQSLFNGKDSNGRRLGVDIRYDAKSDKPIHYQIRGNIPALNDAGHIGISPFGFEYDDERKDYENTRDALYKQTCVRQDYRALYPRDG